MSPIQEKERVFPMVYNNSQIFGFVKEKTFLKEELMNNKNSAKYFYILDEFFARTYFTLNSSGIYWQHSVLVMQELD
ncbi:MAG: hypothetical protein Q8942_12880 [Bacillota bacterium]|nr:hypothetical protein [Bacillota bacterium]